MKVSEIEYSVYSQNGEDGIIQYLIDRLDDCYNVFVEIGCGDGRENNTTRLAGLGWSGVVVDGKPARIRRYKEMGFPKVKTICLKVTPFNAGELDIPKAPDVFSLDMDSTDYHVLKALLGTGFRPSIIVVEYNAAFHLRPLTVPIKMRRRKKNIYYGCGVNAWRNLLEPRGYTFAAVDSCGVNAFFTRCGVGNLETLPWVDCSHFREVLGGHEKRFSQIQDFPLEAA